MSCEKKENAISEAFSGVGRKTEITADPPIYAQKTVVGNTDKYHMTYVPYVPLTINSFTDNLGLQVKGKTITDITFNWGFNKAIESQRIESSAFATVNPEVTGATSYEEDVTGLSITGDTSFTLYADDVDSDGNSEKSDSHTLYFGNEVWIGDIDGIDENTDESTILAALPGMTKFVKTGPSISNYVCLGDTVTKREVYIAPTSHAAPTFKFTNNFTSGGFELLFTMNITNSEGFTEEYEVFASIYGHLENEVLTIS